MIGIESVAKSAVVATINQNKHGIATTGMLVKLTKRLSTPSFEVI